MNKDFAKKKAHRKDEPVLDYASAARCYSRIKLKKQCVESEKLAVFCGSSVLLVFFR